MDDFTFVLTFALPRGNENPEALVDALFEAGCDDATVGVGQRGTIGLDFTRSADSAEDALRSAIQDAARAIPGATLVQAGPDLVGLTDMAAIFGFTRQNMRKYATGKAAFPAPAHVGDPSLWHLAEIVAWLRANTAVQPRDDVFEVAKAAAKINFETEQRRVRRILNLV
jgi:predicted DNA-binding transcriptional regulator AlpA